ncbi:flagellar hook-basal body complex protein [Pseudooceanicola sp. C21-150M6]|uniref:flagellar hook-basal body complex protein n=1 Tax=Pseudooceanicola sp. C21-150M6 TaxID=3434355 RepID=UPI003D7F57D8
MDNAGYVVLTRQSGLMNEMRIVANNISNSSTSGFRQEGAIFSEYVKKSDNAPFLSMALANVGHTSFLQGSLTKTENPLDFAIDGDGFFQVETPDGPRLTRAGGFSLSAEGDLVTHDGNRVLDSGGAPIAVPVGYASLHVAGDGTMSADGQPFAQIGVVNPVDNDVVRQGGVLLEATNGTEPVEIPRVLQGFSENSNVDTIGQIARMIEVQRAYEMGQSFLENEHQRIRNMLSTIVK